MATWIILWSATAYIIQTVDMAVLNNPRSNNEIKVSKTKDQQSSGKTAVSFSKRPNILESEQIAILEQMTKLTFPGSLPDKNTIQKENYEGAFVEGDMFLTDEQLKLFTSSPARKLVNFIGKPYLKWPDGSDGWPEIPYSVTDLPNSLHKTLYKAFDYWHNNTCVKFKPVTDISKPYVGIKLYKMCGSRVGRARTAGQFFGIGEQCSLGNVIHELGHTLGFFHEHQRYDRDQYIFLNSHNVLETCGGRFRGCDPNFREMNTDDMFSYHVPYDLGSIMHYGPKMFTNHVGHFTLGARDGELAGVLGQRSRLSFRDVHLTNLAYNCIGKWVAMCGLKADPCKNEGYLGANCHCICPPGTLGSYCEDIIGKYYDNVKPACNRFITSPTIISATSGDVHKLPGDVDRPAAWCVFTIQAPTCHVPVLTIHQFHIPDLFWQSKVRCKYAWVEIREHYQTSGNMYCGTALRRGTRVIGASYKMYVFFNVGYGLSGMLSAAVSFQKEAHCDSEQDEGLRLSLFGKPISTGNCRFQYIQEGYLWRSPKRMNGPELCSVFFQQEPEPFGLILMLLKMPKSERYANNCSSTSNKTAVSNTPCTGPCQQVIHFCHHEDRCFAFNYTTIPAHRQIMVATSAVVFEYWASDPSCRFRLHIRPIQTSCHKIMEVDNATREEVMIIDEPPGTCQLWCKTRTNNRVRVQIKLERILVCGREWLEVSGGKGDNHKRQELCVKELREPLNVSNPLGYWYTFDSDDSDSHITMQAHVSSLSPIIVKCILKD